MPIDDTAIEQRIAQAVIAEREACAETALQWKPETPEAQDDLSAFGYPESIADKVTPYIAAAIRARQ